MQIEISTDEMLTGLSDADVRNVNFLLGCAWGFVVDWDKSGRGYGRVKKNNIETDKC